MTEAKRNIEAKYAGVDLAAVRQRAAEVGARPAEVLVQTDIFFTAPQARLKLRAFADGGAELISYRRADRAEARRSDYLICPIAEPAALRAVLADALGEGLTVHKRRELWLWANTRLHLDEVEGLGSFVELETVVDRQTLAEAHAELLRVAAALGLRAEQVQALPYVELLAAKARRGASTDL